VNVNRGAADEVKNSAASLDGAEQVRIDGILPAAHQEGRLQLLLLLLFDSCASLIHDDVRNRGGWARAFVLIVFGLILECTRPRVNDLSSRSRIRVGLLVYSRWSVYTA
jgi:hypothetical protein